MSSIIKVDQIQLASGNVARPKDLGLDVTGTPIQVTQAFSGGRVSGTANTWLETNCTHSITPLYNDSKFICHAHQNFRIFQNSGTVFRAGIRLKRRIGGGAWTVLTNTEGHRETFQTRVANSVTQELGSVFAISFLDAPSHNGSVVEYMLEVNKVQDSGGSTHTVISWEGSRGNFMNITEIAG
jgi:hypothetical protein